MNLLSKTIELIKPPDKTAMDEVRARWTEELAKKARQVRDEPAPDAGSLWEHVFAEVR